MTSGPAAAKNEEGYDEHGGLVMIVRDIEFFDRTLLLASSTPPVVVERRRGPDRRAGMDRREADQSPVVLQQGDQATSAADRSPTVTELEYTTPWQLPPGDTGA
jgi:hypothetical protein